MKQRLVVATNNKHKAEEIKDMLLDFDFEVLSLADLNIDIEVEENGSTYAENALIKAMALRDLTEGWILADDSGLEIDALDRAPGIYSARYLGEETPYLIKNSMILDKLEDVEDRSARFVCSIALVFDDGSYWITVNKCEGSISESIQGIHGFGYDPIFIPQGHSSTFGVLSVEIKNSISHRAKALQAVVQYCKLLTEESYV
ncbi:MAG: RdgB/HAM1 family non-canonical purine NTP pyrophosphatase [Erysipelotrichaceae bacterium]|nr:RdgB/HAM1 family non-canonical purine NTP pyrophosphatase [Erysipelotrichaceae bacterium]MDP3304476.1 RdgB/HAM1 family non-canonical purine NTP pyrophosphatase [Erysipelotrichaceae bacterium]